MALPNLALGPIVALGVVGLFVFSVMFFILNKMGYVRNGEEG
jgi:hypothetical protein